MFAVCAVGALALSLGRGGVDPVYGGYFGLMAFVSGLLDLNLAIESLVWIEWSEWKQWHQHEKTGAALASLVRPAMYLSCAAAQLASSFVAYLVYKDAEGMEDEDEPIFATQDQARIYNAVLSHSQRNPRDGGGIGGIGGEPRGAASLIFAGSAHKLP